MAFDEQEIKVPIEKFDKKLDLIITPKGWSYESINMWRCRGKVWKEALKVNIPTIRQKENLDFVIVNGENAVALVLQKKYVKSFIKLELM